MKKIYLLSAALILALSGCQDVNDKFDSWLPEETQPKNVLQEEIEIGKDYIATIVSATKGTDDQTYGELLSKDQAFSENAPASILIPYLLPKLYFSADVGSTVNATYAYKNNRDAVLAGLTTTTTNPAYRLQDSDYQSVWGDPYPTALTPAKAPATVLPKILKNNFPDAADDSYKIVEYSYSEAEPIVTNELNIYTQNFEGLTYKENDPIAIKGWLNVDFDGTRSWQMKERDNSIYAQASSNGSKGKNDNWLIMESIDLTGTVKPFLTFDVKIGYYNSSCLEILVSTNFDGNQANIKTAKWDNLTSQFTIPTTPTNTYGAKFESAGNANLTPYIGKKVYIAFRYKGDDTSTPKATTTYQIDDIKVADEQKGSAVESKYTVYAAYQKVDEVWKPVASNIIVLQPEDYVYAQSPKGYFTTDEAPARISAVLLKNEPQIAGSKKVVVYKTSNANFYADNVTFAPPIWTIDSQIENKTEQFILSTVGWVFDPTIAIVMKKGTTATDDYMLVVNYVKGTYALENPELINKYGDSEFYYGFGANYGNITFRNSDRVFDKTYPADGTDAEKLAFCKKRAIEGLEIFLGLKLPDAKPDVNGVVQKAKVTTTIYYGPASSNTENFVYEFQCVGTKEWKFLQRTSLLTGEVEKAKE